MSVNINKFVDPKTGETVSKCFIPEFHQKDIEEAIGAHQQNMNQFIGASQQYFNILTGVMDIRAKMVASEKNIKEKLQFACKRIGINEQDPWNYNMVEKVFELREPPAVVPLSNDLLGGYDITNQGAVSGK
jgi:hypothetical protein